MTKKLFQLLLTCAFATVLVEWSRADLSLMEQHCAKCHAGMNPKGDFRLTQLGELPNDSTADFWVSCLEYVRSEEMPPPKHSKMTPDERDRVVAFLRSKVQQFEEQSVKLYRSVPRRLNNREFANSICDVLMIEDVGTHEPTSMLLGDSLADGFDTNGESLGMSEYHLDQYVAAIRKILDATILAGERPLAQTYRVPAKKLRVTDRSNRRRAEKANRTDSSIDLLDLRNRAYFENFHIVPSTGRYRITLRTKAIDRHVYHQDVTGIYDDDPLRLRVHMGNRTKDFDLPEDEILEIELDEWLAEGTRLEFSHLTDGLRLQGNGNFKFQYRLARDYIKANDPELYEWVLREKIPKSRFRQKSPGHWSHWTEYWQGPRPRLYSADVQGPLYQTWPPKRQVSLLGESPMAENALAILRPIARRAWRRDVTEQELAPIAELVKSKAKALGDIEALKEGVVAILVSPSFLMINSSDPSPADRFATKFSYTLASTTPDAELMAAARSGKLDSLRQVRSEVSRWIDSGKAEEFLREFPRGWLQLDRINFMAPDPERYPLYEKKRISDDMVNEALAFFHYAVVENRPIPELLTADYSFVNADLAKVYGLTEVPSDSVLRKYTFEDKRRGGFLGMGAFLTLTADTLATSPIHRAIYVMENFMGIHPSPPPADVNIEEPDIRSAETIREVLEAHRSDESCAACHQRIDPYGYAFENFDPIGAWRDSYTHQLTAGNVSGDKSASNAASKRNKNATKKRKRRRTGGGLPIDASAMFPDGSQYRDITELRQLLKSDANRERFVRCFVSKFLTYANGEAPSNYSAVEAIVERSAASDYRIVETIAAAIDSDLFRERP